MKLREVNMYLPLSDKLSLQYRLRNQNLSRALTVVDVPVQNQDAGNAGQPTGSQGRHSHVVVEAEAHSARALRVVPRRPDHRKGTRNLPSAHRLHCLHGRT